MIESSSNNCDTQLYCGEIFDDRFRGCGHDDGTHLRPYEAKFVEDWEAFSLDRQTHATTWPDGGGNFVSAHGHIDRAKEELQKHEEKRLHV